MLDAFWRKWANLIAGLIVIVGGLMVAGGALAVPSMARQTGYQCAKCHAGYPELTNFGRQFKIGAYSMTSEKWDDRDWSDRIPVSVGTQVAQTKSADTSAGGTMPTDFPHDGKLIGQQLAFYYGGKITENSGAFAQYNYDGIEQKWGAEMIDVRWAKETDLGDKEFTYGLTLNNNPTVSDVFNSTPAFGFPHVGTAAKQMPPASMIDMTLASKVAGIGVYGWWNDAIYAELDAYRTVRSGGLRFLGAGQRWDSPDHFGLGLDGYAPYWRLALQQIWGPHTLEVGTYGMAGSIWQDYTTPLLGSNHYRDIAVDWHYHYQAGNQSASIGGTLIHETKTWTGATQAAGMTSNASDDLRTLRIDMHYYYGLKWGGGLEYFRTTGSTNNLAYNTGDALMGSATGSPNTSGWMPELNYFPRQNIKLALRYTKFTQFNGASTNYDGTGRNASDNNNWFALAWFMF